MAIPFKSRLRREGTSNNVVLPIPAFVVKGPLAYSGFTPPGWVRLTVAQSEPFFAYMRYPKTRPSAVVTLPGWLDFSEGEVEATVENAAPWKAGAPPTDSDWFDWLDYIDDARFFPIEDGVDILLLWQRHGRPFRMARFSLHNEAAFLLSLPLPRGRHWSYASSDPHLLADVAKHLQRIGLRLYLEIVRNKSMSVGEVRAAFDKVGVPIERDYTRGTVYTPFAVLHVRASAPLVRIFKNAVAGEAARTLAG